MLIINRGRTIRKCLLRHSHQNQDCQSSRQVRSGLYRIDFTSCLWTI